MPCWTSDSCVHFGFSRSAASSYTPHATCPTGGTFLRRRSTRCSTSSPNRKSNEGVKAVKAELFRVDVERKPSVLTQLATELRRENPWVATDISAASRIVLLGMGSSHYANSVAAARLRSIGVDAIAEIASSDLLPAVREGTVVIAVSASGGSVETLDAVGRYEGQCPIIALTNVDGSDVAGMATRTLLMGAEKEEGGVACRSFLHTLALLLALESHLGGEVGLQAVLAKASAATADLIDRQDDWLPRLSELAIGPHGTHLVAPARRMSSAQQGSLMLREGPRLAATGCETGDWSHVDVYLTKTTDYRLVLFAGSRWEPQLLTWVSERGSTLVAVGRELEGSAFDLRYRHDDDDDVRLLAEVTVAELLAASLWQ